MPRVVPFCFTVAVERCADFDFVVFVRVADLDFAVEPEPALDRVACLVLVAPYALGVDRVRVRDRDTALDLLDDVPCVVRERRTPPLRVPCVRWGARPPLR